MDATEFLQLNGTGKILVTDALIAMRVATSKEDAMQIITGQGQGVTINKDRITEDKEVGPCRICLGWKTIKVME